jgi:hypothetical protein
VRGTGRTDSLPCVESPHTRAQSCGTLAATCGDSLAPARTAWLQAAAANGTASTPLPSPRRHAQNRLWEWSAEGAIEQVDVDGERERGGVVPGPALHLDGVPSGCEQLPGTSAGACAAGARRRTRLREAVRHAWRVAS